jgi:hypothetical protein
MDWFTTIESRHASRRLSRSKGVIVMVNYFRLKGPFAIALSLAAVLWMLPASASESSGPVNETATAGAVPAAAIVADIGGTQRLVSVANSEVTRTPSVGKSRRARQRWRASSLRRTAYHLEQRIRYTVSRSECSDIWCGRHFVLLLGIGF